MRPLTFGIGGLGFGINRRSQEQSEELGFEVCDLQVWDLQAKANTRVSSWDMSNPVLWDLGFGALAARWRAVSFGLWVLGLGV